jgi:hypothetical protein
MANKQKRIEIKVTPAHHEKLLLKAAQHGMCISELLLFCALNSRINCTVGIPENRHTYEIDYAWQMYEKGKLTKTEYDRIKAGLIEKISKTTVQQPEINRIGNARQGGNNGN